MGEHDELVPKSRFWDTATVNARLKQEFSAEEFAGAALVLADLAPAPDCPDEADETACRLMLAAIRVSEGSLAKLAMWVGVARMDPRDLLAAAEYRHELQASSEASRVLDLEEYLAWVSGTVRRVE